ncbi:hypothetical protein JRQ81_007190 [Phrynocephalus forsythii]|uniref:Uncharacterized protein n=1 Tax=Phrynocephalus forsythii TaxID=171643 RepID=A0A9Q0XD03_9SAUR|nr:hypothetical protein JRQ81_007190 [Phrynocephalus forsythii]
MSGSQEENKEEQKNQPVQQELLTEASPLRTGCRLCLRRCCAGRPRVAPQPASGSREEEEEEQKDGRQQQELLMEASALWRVGRWCLTCCCASRPRVAPEPASASEEGKVQEEAMEEPPQKEEDVKKEEPPQEEEEKEQEEEKDHPAETSTLWGSMVVQAPGSVRSSLAEAPPHLMSDVESEESRMSNTVASEVGFHSGLACTRFTQEARIPGPGLEESPGSQDAWHSLEAVMDTLDMKGHPRDLFWMPVNQRGILDFQQRAKSLQKEIIPGNSFGGSGGNRQVVFRDSMPLGASAVSRNSLEDLAFKPRRITGSLLVATSKLLDVEVEELSSTSASPEEEVLDNISSLKDEAPKLWTISARYQKRSRESSPFLQEERLKGSGSCQPRGRKSIAKLHQASSQVKGAGRGVRLPAGKQREGTERKGFTPFAASSRRLQTLQRASRQEHNQEYEEEEAAAMAMLIC